MRTKTLLLSALACAVGASAASAQVYSVNAVGYVNVDVPPGFSMIANQLDSDDVSIESLFPDVPLNTRIFKWSGTEFEFYDYVDIGLGSPIWSPDGQATLAPGEGAFIFNPGAEAFTVTFVGEVSQNADSNISIPAGFSIVSSAVPQSGALESGLAFPVVENDRVFKWAGGQYEFYDFVDIGLGEPIWSPSEPEVAVGEAFFVSKSAATDWVRNFSVNE